MIIKKIGHCCLRVEENGVSILIDPGAWTSGQNNEKNLSVVLITQEHGDHLDIKSLQEIISNNPGVKILTNAGVGEILKKEKIEYELMEHEQTIEVQGVKIKSFVCDHAEIYPSIPPIINTGFLIADKFYHPGDALYVPSDPVEILALPVVGPWLTIAQAIDYAKEVAPKVCFPVHDGMLKILGPFHSIPERMLTPLGIKFVSMKEDSSLEL